MRVLLLTQYYPPEPEIRNHMLARGLADRGHEVQVVTAFPNYPKGHIYPGFHMRPWMRDQDNGLSVLRVPIYPDHGRSSFGRALNFLSFGVSASCLGPVLCGGADVVFAYHPSLTTGLAAWVYSLTRGAPFIFDIQDMWPETLEATGMVTRPSLLRAFERMAQFVYKRATAITVISPGFKSLLVNKGVPEDKIRVIHNWVDESLFQPMEPDMDLARDQGFTGRFNVLYAGNMGLAQGLNNVLEAASLIKDLTNVAVVLMGDGVDKAMLEAEVRRRGLHNVHFLPAVPITSMPKYYTIADAVLIHLADQPLFEITIPGKLQISLASGRPVIACVAGDAAEMVHAAQAGLVAQPGRPEDLARAIREMAVMSRPEREKLGKAGREFFLKSLSRQVLLDQFELLFRDVAESRGNRMFKTRNRAG